jgi:hypothetical protein
MKWHDKVNVVMISNHDTEMKSVTKRGKETQKPICGIDYNKWMGGVDLQTCLVERKRMHKWYMKLFRRLLNAMIIYQHNTGKQIDQLAFRVNLVEALFHQFTDTEHKVPGRRAGDNTIPQLQERHFIHKVPPPGKKSASQRRCMVCTKNGRRYCCLQCDVGLCLEECFEAYHTKLNF